MKITKEMLDIWNLAIDALQDVRAKTIEQYMEYPEKDSKRKWVMQSHVRGESQHLDFRMETNGHLLGWSIVGGSVEQPITPQRFLDKIGKGFRAETKCWSEFCNEWKYDIVEKGDGFEAIFKGIRENLSLTEEIEELARQPKIWLRVKGEVKPGEVGAGEEVPGKFDILANGTYWEGAQKSYFHEYFVKGGPFKKYTRVVVRAIRVPRIDPDTKKPTGQFELMWRFMIPKDQEAYALSKRAMDKKWKPPKEVIPIPPDQRSGENWDKWQEYMKGKEKEEKSEKTIDFTLQRNSWMGPIHVRAVPVIEYYLRLDDKGEGPVRSFFSKSNPIRISSFPLIDEGRVPRKYLTFDGKIDPGEKYNPNKELMATMSIVDKGKVSYESIKDEEDKEIINLNFKGDQMRGKSRIVQEEEGSEFFTFESLSQESLAKGKFVLQKHYWGEAEHFDIRMDFGKESLDEFNLFTKERKPPQTYGVEEPILANYKTCPDKSWMEIDKPKSEKMVGNKVTYVDPIDKGSVNQIEDSEGFKSYEFDGEKLKGYYVAKKSPKGWFFIKSKLPSPHSEALVEGDPETEDFYKPFLFEQKKGWNYYWLRIYDLKQFTRCESDYKKYLPDLKLPSGILDVLVCLYPVPGKLHRARVTALKVSNDLNKEQAISWIKANDLHTFSSEMIRRKDKLYK